VALVLAAVKVALVLAAAEAKVVDAEVVAETSSQTAQAWQQADRPANLYLSRPLTGGFFRSSDLLFQVALISEGLVQPAGKERDRESDVSLFAVRIFLFI
jgi:hypothetical protein